MTPIWPGTAFRSESATTLPRFVSCERTSGRSPSSRVTVSASFSDVFSSTCFQSWSTVDLMEGSSGMSDVRGTRPAAVTIQRTPWPSGSNRRSSLETWLPNSPGWLMNRCPALLPSTSGGSANICEWPPRKPVISGNCAASSRSRFQPACVRAKIVSQPWACSFFTSLRRAVTASSTTIPFRFALGTSFSSSSSVIPIRPSLNVCPPTGMLTMVDCLTSPGSDLLAVNRRFAERIGNDTSRNASCSASWPASNSWLPIAIAA
ncbi:MAG: hypothetical protein BWY66_01421 [bacterium ADurb.Bin374]|nr:MAG: hypothetical protein BWY66_01421 [bacterium ADurb.Bin374]